MTEQTETPTPPKSKRPAPKPAPHADQVDIGNIQAKLEMMKQAKMNACMEHINNYLKDNNLELVAIVMIVNNTIQSQVQIREKQ